MMEAFLCCHPDEITHLAHEVECVRVSCEDFVANMVKMSGQDRNVSKTRFCDERKSPVNTEYFVCESQVRTNDLHDAPLQMR